MRDRPALRRRLVAAILGALKDVHPPGWSLSEEYIKYMAGNSDEISWVPDLDYYIKLIRRIVESILFITKVSACTISSLLASTNAKKK